MQNLNLSKQKFLLKIQKLNLKMLKLKKTRKYLRKFSWIDAQKKPLKLYFHVSLGFHGSTQVKSYIEKVRASIRDKNPPCIWTLNGARGY